jgi:hypothetical protein
MPNDRWHEQILDFRVEKIRSAIRLAYHEYRQALARAESDFKSAMDEACNEVRGLDREIERVTMTYAEQYDAQYLLQRIFEAQKVKHDGDEET